MKDIYIYIYTSVLNLDYKFIQHIKERKSRQREKMNFFNLWKVTKDGLEKAIKAPQFRKKI